MGMYANNGSDLGPDRPLVRAENLDLSIVPADVIEMLEHDLGTPTISTIAALASVAGALSTEGYPSWAFALLAVLCGGYAALNAALGAFSVEGRLKNAAYGYALQLVKASAPEGTKWTLSERNARQTKKAEELMRHVRKQIALLGTNEKELLKAAARDRKAREKKRREAEEAERREAEEAAGADPDWGNPADGQPQDADGGEGGGDS